MPSIKSNSALSARSASLSESDWDWARRSAFYWLATAIAAGEMNEYGAKIVRKGDGSESMSSTQHHIAVQAQRLIPLVAELYERALTLEKNYGEALQRVDAAYRDSARNLLHYLAVRQIDIRQLQTGLASIGLSSLGRMEAHTLSTLNEVLFALHRITGQNWAPIAKSPVDFNTGEISLNRRAETLLGLPAGKRSVRIMVTM